MIEVRPVRSEEYAAAADVTVEGYRSFYRERLGDYGERLRDIAGRGGAAIVLVAVEDGRILGTVTYVADATSRYAEKQRPDEASIRMLSVAPEEQRRGVGRELTLACIERARREGKRAVVLHADEMMAVSRRLYEILGFRREPDRDYRPDEETMLLCYVLPL